MIKPWQAKALLAALVLSGILPFLSRAVYIDEHQYLFVARSVIEKDWLFPQDTKWTFFGKAYENLGTQTHLQVVEYYLAGIFKLAGRFDPIEFRALFAVFPLLAVFSFYRIAQRFTSNPLPTACLFAVSPAFFVLSPTLMMDIPMLAFLLTGLCFYFDAIERRKRLWPSSLCFILAVGAGYVMLVPLACLFTWSAANRRPAREWIAIAVAPFVIAVWLTVMKIHFGQLAAKEMADYYTSHFSFSQLVLPMLSFMGGVSLVPWSWPAFAETGSRRSIVFLSIPAAFALTITREWNSISDRLWFVLLASSGIGLLILFVRKALSKGTQPRAMGYGFLVLWFPAMLLFLLVFAEMIAARYILLALPPLFLVAFDRIRPRPTMAAVGATAILSLALSVADYRLVNSYPRWVQETIVPLQQQGFRVWNGGESGMRYYLEQNGVQTLSSSDLRPRGGDLIVRQTSFRYILSKELEPLLMNLLRTDLTDTYILRTFSRDAGAGFHDSHFGLVPFTISRQPLDQVEIEEVSPFVTSLPQSVPPDFSTVPVWFPGGVLLKQVEPEMRFPTRIPRNVKVTYDLEGKGSVSLSTEGIVLRKENPGPAIWKNFRIIPYEWQH